MNAVRGGNQTTRASAFAGKITRQREVRPAVLTDLDDEACILVTYGILRGGPFGKVLNLPAGYHLDDPYQGLNQIALVIPEPPPTKLLAAVLLVLWVTMNRRRQAGPGNRRV